MKPDKKKAQAAAGTSAAVANPIVEILREVIMRFWPAVEVRHNFFFQGGTLAVVVVHPFVFFFVFLLSILIWLFVSCI